MRQEQEHIKLSEIFRRVKDILIDKLKSDENELTLSASLSNDLGADSLDIVEIKMEVEREFDIIISAEYDKSIITVEDFVKFTFNYLTKGKESNKKYFKIIKNWNITKNWNRNVCISIFF